MNVRVSSAEAGLMSWRLVFWNEMVRDSKLVQSFRKERSRCCQTVASIARVLRRWSWGLWEMSIARGSTSAKSLVLLGCVLGTGSSMLLR